MAKDSNNNFRIGDKIIDFGQVYRIFRIKSQTLFFRPYFQTKRNQDLVCSLPVENIEKANIRKPISLSEVKELLADLSQPPQNDGPVDTTRLREKLNSNDPFKTARVLKDLWLDKNDENTNFSRYKQEVYELALGRLVEEAAFVVGCQPTQAKKKIKRALKKSNEKTCPSLAAY